MIVVPAPKHRIDRPLGHRPWTVSQPPVTRRRRSRNVLMQITVEELLQGSRPRPLPRPRWRRAASALFEGFVVVFGSDDWRKPR